MSRPLLALAGLLAAAPAAADTLQDALMGAYANNAQLLAERAQLRAADENVPQALAGWKPTVTAFANQGVIHNSSKEDCEKAPKGLFGSPPDCSYHGLNTFQQLWPQGYGVTITQPLYRGGRTVAQTAEAYDVVHAEQAHLLDTEQTVFLNVVGDYLNLSMQEQLLDLSRDFEKFLADQLGGTERRFHAGELTRTDVAETASAQAQATTTRQQVETQLQVYRAAFEHDVGAPAGKLLPPSVKLNLPATRSEALNLAAQANPAVVSAEFNEKAAADDVDVVFGQELPELDLQASIQRSKETPNSGSGSSGLRTDTGQVLAQLSVPLYQGGAVSAQVRQGQQIVTQKARLADDARRAAVQAAAQAWDSLQGTRATIGSLERQVAANVTAVQGAQHDAKTGDRGIFEIVNEEQILFNSRANLLQAKRDELLYQFALAQALGRLTAKDLDLPIQVYDLDAYLDTGTDNDPGLGARIEGSEQ